MASAGANTGSRGRRVDRKVAPEIALRALRYDLHRAETARRAHARLPTLADDLLPSYSAADAWLALASFPDETAFRAHNDVNRRYPASDVRHFEDRVARIDAALARLPREVTRGYRLGRLWGNRQHLLEAPRALRAIQARAVAEAEEGDRALAANVAALEALLHRELDDRFAAQRPAMRRALDDLPPEQLYQAAVALIGELDAMTTGKTIRRERVEHGESSSVLHDESDSWGIEVSRDVRGGERLAAGGSSSSRHGRSSSSYQRDQLLLHAADYRVRVRGVRFRASEVDAATTIEARAVVEHLVEIHEIARALARRAPQAAAVLHDWVEHSRVVFDAAQPGWSGINAEIAVGVGHVHRDALALQRYGIVSERLAQMLRGDVIDAATIGRIGGGSALLQRAAQALPAGDRRALPAAPRGEP